MSRSPVENPHATVPRLDLSPYFLNRECAAPDCDREATDNHHIFRRSLGKGFRDAWWVEHEGQLLPNRVGLCGYHHRLITENRARIRWHYFAYWWVFGDDQAESKLNPHPPLEPAMQLELHDHGDVKEGHDCPTCHRRVPHKKKTTSPTTKVFSVRVPLDDAETFSELVDTAAEHLGLKAKPNHRYNALLAGLVLVLQAGKKELAS